MRVFKCDFMRMQVLESAKGECMQVRGHASAIVHECECVRMQVCAAY